MPQVAELAPKPVQKRNRALNDTEAEGIIRLISERHFTETEAAIYRGFKPEAWFHWKSRRRNDSRFSQVTARVKAAVIDRCIDGIEAAGPKDWRAYLARLQLLDRNRFSIQPQQQEQAPVIHNTTVHVLIEQLYSQAKSLPCGVQATIGSVPVAIEHNTIPQDAQAIECKAIVKPEE